MKKKILISKKLTLNKEKLDQLNQDQLTNILGGRMAATTFYTSTNGDCCFGNTSCCSTAASACCG